MKTIEERAKEYSLKDFDGYYTGREKAIEEGYIAGAKEQKVIDDANLHERFEKVLNGQKWDLIDKAKSAFDKACGWLNVYPWYNAVFEEFRKAMEE